ncbi:hypothetical protein B0H14DRAFT_2455039, partial [Mycena olivaceomarginata]
MTADDVKIVFGNIGELAELSDVFCEALERTIGSALEDPDATDDHIGELFLRYAPELEGPYKQYITRHPSALAHLTALPQTPELIAYHQKTRDLAVSLSHAWDLQSLLIKPVQRLLKYSLLLTAIIDATALTHPDPPASCERTHRHGGRRAPGERGPPPRRGRQGGPHRAKKAPNPPAHQVLPCPRRRPQLRRRARRPHGRRARPHRRLRPTARAHRPGMGPRRRRRRTRAPRLGQLLLRRHRPLLRRALRGFRHLSRDSSRTASSPSPRVSCLRSLRTCWPRWRASSRARPNRASSFASMAEHAPLHHHLLTMPVSAKNRPPPALLSASAHYLALRTQLAAELPAYLALLHRGLSALVRRLAGLQAGFFGEARDAWAGLWDMLRVEGERNGGGEETVGVWRARWGDVDNGVAGLRICRPLRGSSTLGPAAAQLTPAEAVARAYSEPTPINTHTNTALGYAIGGESSSPSSLAYANGGPPSPHYERNSRDREYNQRGEYSYRDSSNSGGGKHARLQHEPEQSRLE